MERIKTLSLSLCTLMLAATPRLQAQTVDYVTKGEVFRIEEQHTQSERKPGWRIMDIQMKSTLVRYLWGRCSKQLVDSNRPQFIVDTDTLLLSDMALIKLRTKKEYRRIPEPEVRDNACIYVDFTNFDIQPHGDENFLIRPLSELPPGEYIFTWITAPKIGDHQDWVVWPFSVE